MTLFGIEFEGPFTKRDEIVNRRGVYVVMHRLLDDSGRTDYRVHEFGESPAIRMRVTHGAWMEVPIGDMVVALRYTTDEAGIAQLLAALEKGSKMRPAT